MVKRNVCCFVLTLCMGHWASLPAQPINEKVDAYLQSLKERPDNSYVYDRFYDAWLDTGTTETLEAFLKANQDKEDTTTTRLLLAFFYERQDQEVAALEVYRTARANAARNPVFLLCKARAEARNLQFEIAIEDLLKASALRSPTEVTEKTGKLLGELYVRTGQKDKAIALWREIIDGHPEDAALSEELIELQIKEGLLDEAIRTSNQFIAQSKDPYKTITAMLRKGDIYLYKMDKDQAIAVYAEALESTEQGSWLENQILAQMEQVFIRDDDTLGWREHLSDLTEKYPSRIGLKRRLASLLIQTGQTDQALSLFEAILKVTPGDRDNQKAYVQALTAAGQWDRAIEVLDRLFIETPQDLELLIQLADLYHKAEQPDKAAEALLGFLNRSDRTESTYVRVGGLMERYGLQDQAEALYQRMTKAYPESLTAMEVYARFLYGRGRQEQALDLFATVARRGDLQMLLSASNAAGTRDHYDLALQWLQARANEFARDVTYLNQLCKVALRAGAFDQALTWARRQLDLAETFPMIQIALSQVLSAAQSANQVDQLIRELEAEATLTIQNACLLGELLETRRQSDRAQEILTRAAALNPDIALRQQIRLLRLRQAWPQAAESLASLITRTGNRDTQLIRELIELYQKMDRPEDALQWIRTWETVAPQDATARIYHARLLKNQGKAQEAADMLETLDRGSGAHSEVLSELAQIYQDTGRHNEAWRLYWRLYEDASTLADRLKWVGSLYEVADERGKIQDLTDRLRRQQQGQPDSAEPLLLLAEVYRRSGQYEPRRQALLDATRINTRDLDLLHELATLEEAQGHWPDAVTTLEKATALDPTPKTRLKLARLHIQKGDKQAGFRMLMDMAGGQAMNPRDAESIAVTMMCAALWDWASEFLQGLLPQYPKDYKLHYLRAVALEEAGRSTDAAEAFVDLLSLREEIPGNTAAPRPFTWSRQGMDTHIERILPPEAVALLKLQQAYGKAYRYKQSQRPISRAGSSGTPMMVTGPDTISDLQDMAVCHLLHLGVSMPDHQKRQIQSDLKRHGIPNADILTENGGLDLTNLNQTIELLANRYPDDPVIQALWAIQRFEGQGCTLQEAEHLFDLFKVTNPRLAMLVGLGCYGKDPIASRLFSQSLALLNHVRDPGYYEVRVLTFCLGNQNQPVQLTTQQRELLDTYLINGYQNLYQGGGNMEWLFSYVASILAQRRELTDYIRFLDDEISHYAASSGQSQGRVIPNTRLVSPSSPLPLNLPSFPNYVLNQLRASVSTGQSPNRSPMRQNNTPNPALLVRSLDMARDPVLKILLAMVSGQKEKAETLIRDLIASDPTAVAGYLLGANLASNRGRFEEAVNLLAKARALSLPQIYLDAIDRSIVGLAVNLESKSKGADICRDAVQRRMTSQLTPEEWSDLLVASERLGLKEQTENLRQQIAATGYKGTFNLDIDGIRQLLDSGKTESALSLALGYLTRMSTMRPYPFNLQESDARSLELITLLQGRHLIDSLIKLAEPTNNSDNDRLLVYGDLCQLLSEPDKARAVYERIVKQDPVNSNAGLRLAMLSAQTDPRRAARDLATIAPQAIGQLGIQLADAIERFRPQRRPDQVFNLVEMVTAYLEQTPDPNHVDLNWIPRVAQTLARPMVNRSPTPYVRSGRIVRQSDFMNPLDTENRRTQYLALCRAMLKIPKLAPIAFSNLLMEAQTGSPSSESFTNMARQVLLTGAPGTPIQTTQTQRIINGQWIRAVDPAEYLARQAWKEHDLDDLVSGFIPLLRQRHRTDQAIDLERFVSLYQARIEAFFSIATELMKTGTTQGLVAQGTMAQAIVEAYQIRDLSNDSAMEAFLLDGLRQDLTAATHLYTTALQYRILTLLQTNETAGKAFLDRVLITCDTDTTNGRSSSLGRIFQSMSRAIGDNENSRQDRLRADPGTQNPTDQNNTNRSRINRRRTTGTRTTRGPRSRTTR
ncbi:MAG: tetratricopeptide repeat protein [Phycisphaerae bacterium]|nr:tetratricopeptide repeat protein [Phycisphaerae bacterium]